MLYQQLIEGCLEAKVKHRGLPNSTYQLWLNRTGESIENLRQAYSDNSLPLLRLPEERDDISAACEAIDRLTKNSKTLIFLGTGGSSLGGQTLTHFSKSYIPGNNESNILGIPRIIFSQNLDAHTLQETLKSLDLKSTRFVIISKSGGTIETLLQAMITLGAVIDAGLEQDIPDLFLGLTEPWDKNHKNGLRSLCEHYKIPVLDHHTGIGGRFSVFTNVGLLPAIARKMDVVKLRQGAAQVIDNLMTAKTLQDCPPAVAAAIVTGLTLERDIHNVVLMPYSDQLGKLPKWFVQLWAESLGKDGKGATPVAAQGPVDQHSQLQLYLDGRPHMLTIIRQNCQGQGNRVKTEIADIAGMSFLGKHTTGDLVCAEQSAIVDALIEANRPVRTIDVDYLDEEVLGALMMHFMIETILVAGLLGIDPYDQPAVERGKVLTKQYLVSSKNNRL